MEINLKFIWRPAGGARCKVKWLFMLIDADYPDGDVALNEQIDAIAAEVTSNEKTIFTNSTSPTVELSNDDCIKRPSLCKK